jgi:hypothetical protein
VIENSAGQANDRLGDPDWPDSPTANPVSDFEWDMWHRIRGFEKFWNTQARGFVEVRENFIVNDRERTEVRVYWVPPPPPALANACTLMAGKIESLFNAAIGSLGGVGKIANRFERAGKR